ncbi:MAG: SulP family inorganic anion transporter, partial [Candidatus Saccharimonas sp.]
AILVSAPGSNDYANTVIVLSLMAGVVLILIALLKLGSIANLISRPVMVGFLAGVGLQLIIMNLPVLVGLPISHSVQGFVTGMANSGGLFSGLTATVSLLVIGIVMILRRSRVPGEIIGLVLAVLFVIVFRANDYGVHLVGALPGGLPQFANFHMSLPMILTLLPAAIALALVALAQSAVLIRSSAIEHDEEVHLNRDLLALGFSNVVSALSHGFTVNGSPARTVAAESAGSKSSWVNVWAGLMIGAILLFGTQLFNQVPEAALAAVICVLGFRLIRFSEFCRIWAVRRTEFWVAIVALIFTALFGVLVGVGVAIVVSLVERLIRQYRPKDVVLLRDGTLSPWAIERIGGDYKMPKELVIYGFNGPLYFENVEFFKQRLLQSIKRSKSPVWAVVIDASTIDSIDYTAATVVETLSRRLNSDGVSLGFAHVSPNLMSQLKIYGIISLVGEDRIYSTLRTAVKAYTGPKATIAERIERLKLAKDSYVAVGSAILDALGLRAATSIDIVVGPDTYATYRKRKDWREFTQANDKKTLSHDSYNLMTSWDGSSLKQLLSRSWLTGGVRVMSIDRLIQGKRHIARRKDLADIELLKEFLKSHDETT